MTQSATADSKQQYPIHGKSEPFTFGWGVPLLVRPIRFFSPLHQGMALVLPVRNS